MNPDAPPSAPPTAPAADPPSLLRRAPARVDITLRNGQCPQLSRRGVHLRAGRTLVVQVVPQHAAAKVEITAESPLHAAMPPQRIEGGPVPTHHAEYVGRSPLRVFPLPVRGRVYISIADGRPKPPRITVPVIVWPSVGTLALWWLGIYIAIVAARWKDTVAHSSSVRDVVPQVWNDVPFLVELLLFGGFVLIPLRVLGYLISTGGSGDADE